MIENNKDAVGVMMQHRSVRRFKDKAVDAQLLDELVRCGLRASNTGNMQLYSIIATQEEPRRSQLCQLHFGQCATAPLWLTICADVNRYHAYCRVNGCDEPYDNFLWFLSATVDASLAAQNLCVAAEARGLGFCYLGTVMYNTAQIASMLECPKGVVPVITLAMGYPDEEPQLSERLEPEAIVHRETYHDYTDEETVRLHEVRDQFPFNREMVRQNGTRNYCEIFTTKRYPKEQNVSISRSLMEFLHQAGMMNF